MISSLLLLLLSSAAVTTTNAFVVVTTTKPSKTQHNRVLNCLNNAQNDDNNNSIDDEQPVAGTASTSSRRLFGSQFLTTISMASASSFFVLPINAWGAAAKTNEVDEDKEKLTKGYKRLTYLLDNWDRLTEVCDNSKTDPFSGKTVCVKTPLVVSEYMGFKSMADPLFKADKTMRRLEKAGVVPDSRSSDYLDAAEMWQQTSDEAQGMAYTSSWAGPENPNGGDDNIDFFLQRAKKQVVDARTSLGTVVEILQM